MDRLVADEDVPAVVRNQLHRPFELAVLDAKASDLLQVVRELLRVVERPDPDEGHALRSQEDVNRLVFTEGDVEGLEIGVARS